MAEDQSTDGVKLVPVAGATGYFVTVHGSVFTNRVTPRNRRGEMRELRQSVTQYGYRYVRMTIGGKGTAKTIHRIIAETFLPAPLDGQNVVRHLNGDPADNQVENLAWGTQFDNMQDAIRHGRTLRGRKSPNAKLNDNLIRVIRILADEDFSHESMAAFLGVSRRTIDRVVNGEAWENA